MKSIIILLLAVVLVTSGITNAYAQKHLHYYTYNVIKSNYTDNTALKHAITYWHQYSKDLKYSDINPGVSIEFLKVCYGDILGQYYKDKKYIVVYVGCDNRMQNETVITIITEHELGHYLGFDHYSDPLVMKPCLCMIGY